MEERSHSYEQGDMCNPKNENGLLSHNLVQTADESRENVQHEEERESDSNRPLGPTFDVHVSEPLEQGVCGLRNLGNTCYMNAGLQCLISLPAICQHFLQERQSSSEESNLSAPFRNLLLEVWGNKRTDFRPEDFKSSLGTKFSQFEGYRQHDCQEFIALLLSSLHDELKAKKPQTIEGSSSGANRGALESIGAAGTADEDLDEDELRKIEHKNQDEIVTATSQSVAATHAFALATGVPMDIEGQEAIPTETASKCEIAGVSSGMGATIADERTAERSRQVSPSNVMKKMKLDSDFIDYSPPHEMNNGKSAGDSFSPQTDFYSPPPPPNSHEEEFNTAHELNKFTGIDDNGAFIKPHWDMGDSEQDEVVKRKKGSDASTCRVYKEPVKEKPSSKTVESIIAQTFQGQFRNTVCCDGCGDISTTDEPFMYVPVPLPGALDKNFPLFLIPEDPNSHKITFEVKAVNKHGTVADMRAKMMKQLMAAQIKLDGMDVLIALGSRNSTTGFCGSVDRFLEDSVQLSNLPSSGGGSEGTSSDSSVSMGIMTSYYNASSSSNSKNALYFAFVKSRNSHSKPPPVDDERASSSVSDELMRGGGGEIERDVEGHEERGEREEEHGEREPESGDGNIRDERTTTTQEVNSWKTCCICMDDRFDDDLRSHHCGCYLCLDCFQRTKEQQQQSPEQTQMDAALAQFGGACNDDEDMDIMGAIAMEQMNAAGDSTSDDTYSPDNPGSSNSEESSRNKPPVSLLVKCPMCNLMEDEDTGFPFVGKRGGQASSDRGGGDQEDGTKSSSGSGSGRGTRLMMLTVFYRVFNSESGKVEIVDWPRLVYLMDSVSKRDALDTVGSQCLSEVTRYLDFSMHRTESSGLKCSRCYKLASGDKEKQLCECSWLGASWEKDLDTPVDFIPGDSIAIQFYGVAADQLPCLFMPCESLEEDEQITTTASTVDRTDGTSSVSSSSAHVVNGGGKDGGDGMLTLEQCIEAFTAVERLEDGEEWWCERCEASRAARRQMSLLDMPETLVIYLKRFHFHSGTMRSYKLHNPVSCPTLLHIPPSASTSSLLGGSSTSTSSSSACHTSDEIEAELQRQGSTKSKRESSNTGSVGGSNQRERLESEEQIRGAFGADSLPERVRGSGGVIYQLQSYVCHIGESVNSGHYTAFARNALSGQWYYFNDETVTLVEGSPNCHNNRDIYILFYQRIDCSYNINIPPPPTAPLNTAPITTGSTQRPLGRVRSDSNGDNSHQQKNNSIVSTAISTNSGALMLYDPALARTRTSSG